MQEIISNTIKKICADVPEDRVLRNEPMSRHTSFRIGGPAAAFVTVNNEKELAAVMAAVCAAGAEHMMIGNGSNLLVSDDGIEGAVITLGGDFKDISVDGDIITAGAGVKLSRLCTTALENSLGGL